MTFTAEQLKYLEEIIEFTDVGFNVLGNVKGDVYGSVERNVWVDVYGSVGGDVKGNVLGNVWGNVGVVKEKPLQNEEAKEK